MKESVLKKYKLQLYNSMYSNIFSIFVHKNYTRRSFFKNTTYGIKKLIPFYSRYILQMILINKEIRNLRKLRNLKILYYLNIIG
jgi:hypothetical protein